MARLPDHIQLLAIALINFADDEGYFLADPALVRSFARPFDNDSSNVIGSLRELSRVGYIEVFGSAVHGQIGRIVSFKDHQVISHPKVSKFKDYASSNVPVTFHDDSIGNGREWKGTGNGSGAPQPKAESQKQTFNETEVSVALCRERGIVGVEEISLVSDAVKAVGGDHVETATNLLDNWQTHKESGKFPQQLKAFVKEGHWKDSAKPKKKPFNLVEEVLRQRKEQDCMPTRGLENL